MELISSQRTLLWGRKGQVLEAIVVTYVVFSNFDQSLGPGSLEVLGDNKVMIIVIKTIIDRSFGVQQVIDLHHMRDLGEQWAVENR